MKKLFFLLGLAALLATGCASNSADNGTGGGNPNNAAGYPGSMGNPAGVH